jgi:hypothetical protein
MVQEKVLHLCSAAAILQQILSSLFFKLLSIRCCKIAANVMHGCITHFKGHEVLMIRNYVFVGSL